MPVPLLSLSREYLYEFANRRRVLLAELETNAKRSHSQAARYSEQPLPSSHIRLGR